MNSIRYVGANWLEANECFDITPIGKDAWDNNNELYGVVLSIWDSSKQEYVVKRIKGIGQ
jgi:sorbitol-specific phosphotransferase system component IIA